MLLPQITLALAVAVHACSAASTVYFYNDVDQKTYGYSAHVGDYQQCYVAPSQIGISRIVYQNGELFKNDFTMTVYSTPNCGGNYRRWQMYVHNFRKYDISYVGGTMNDKIKSWKVSDMNLGDQEGHTDSYERSITPDYYNEKTDKVARPE